MVEESDGGHGEDWWDGLRLDFGALPNCAEDWMVFPFTSIIIGSKAFFLRKR
jgi:hypothetical protein